MQPVRRSWSGIDLVDHDPQAFGSGLHCIALAGEIARAGLRLAGFRDADFDTQLLPFVQEYREHGVTKKGLLELGESIVKGADLVVITTAHTDVDYDMVSKNADMIFDTKNALKNIENRDNIELL